MSDRHSLWNLATSSASGTALRSSSFVLGLSNGLVSASCCLAVARAALQSSRRHRAAACSGDLSRSACRAFGSPYPDAIPWPLTLGVSMYSIRIVPVGYGCLVEVHRNSWLQRQCSRSIRVATSGKWPDTNKQLQGAMERARSVRGSDWFASMDATHGHLTAEEMTPQACPAALASAELPDRLNVQSTTKLHCIASTTCCTGATLDTHQA